MPVPGPAELRIRVHAAGLNPVDYKTREGQLRVIRRYPLPISLVGTRWIERLHSAKTGVPYGIALAAAALFVYPHTVFMRALAG